MSCRPPPAAGLRQVLPVAVMALLRWAFPPAALDSNGLVAIPSSSSSSDAQQCAASPTADIEWKCGLEIDIFTDGKPDDLWAILAMFRKATDVTHVQQCPPDKYPIKAVFSGGGYDNTIWHSRLVSYLSELKAAGFIPDPPYFDLNSQVHKGPVALVPEREIDLPEGADYRIIDSMLDALPRFVDVLVSQRAPIIVALRPIFEFAVLYTEYRLSPDELALTLSPAYDDFRRNKFPFTNPITLGLVKNSMQAFARSQVVFSHGSRGFQEMGFFYGGSILDHEIVLDPSPYVRELEEAFANLPQKFLLVDRNSILYNEPDPHAHPDALRFYQKPLFTSLEQPRIFELLSSWPQLCSKFFRIVMAFNKHYTMDSSNSLFRALNVAPQKLRRELYPSFTSLATRAHRLSEDAAKGRLVRADLEAWQRDRFSLAAQISRIFRDDRTAADKAIQKYQVWASAALQQGSRVRVGDLLVPLCFEPGNNLVKQSFIRVTYSQMGDGSLHWQDSTYKWVRADPGSASNIWITRSPSNFRSLFAVARQEVLKTDLERYYEGCLSRK